MSSTEQLDDAGQAGCTVRDLADMEARLAQGMKVVEHLILAALLECCSVSQFEQLKSSCIVEDLRALCSEDALTFASKDPASASDIELVARTSTSYSAVLHYRVAHWIYQVLPSPEYVMLAAMVSRRGKLLSGAEIHFKSTIGKRFVLDHGYGTVIGETAVIGDDCYILGGVTLGSRQIAQNTSGPRHPHLGDRVQVGMNACLLGHIHVGDDAFIGAGCLVNRDVLAGQKITLVGGYASPYLT